MRKNTRDITHQGAVQDQVLLNPNLQFKKKLKEKLRVAELIAEASFMKKKRDSEWQAEALRMEEQLAKARAKVYGDMEGISLGIANDTEVFFLPKKFEDNEVALPNVPKEVAFEKTKSRQSGYMTFYHEVKF